VVKKSVYACLKCSFSVAPGTKASAHCYCLSLVELSKKYPMMESESEEEQNWGLKSNKLLKVLSSLHRIVPEDLDKVILDDFCLRPTCKKCPDNTENCKHTR
jgi:hypothetical protein